MSHILAVGEDHHSWNPTVGVASVDPAALEGLPSLGTHLDQMECRILLAKQK
jgi:hypothetical protein